MGGIAAITTRDMSRGRQRVARMLAAAPHRGRDTRFSESRNAVLGTSTDGSADTALVARSGWVIAFTGVLDNRDELGAELGLADRNGGRPVAQADAEVALETLRRWGSPARLRGAFAAVAVPAAGDRLLFFRDHLGFEPLFTGGSGGTRLVASEAKMIVAGTDRAPEPDLEGIRATFFGTGAGGRSSLLGVDRVPGRTLATAEGARLELRSYWEPFDLTGTRRIGLDDARAELRERIERAVRRQVTGRDAISLSGGIDSPAVTAFAARAHLERSGRPLLALSAVFPEHPEVDETPWIELAAESLGADLRTYRISTGVLDDIEHWVRLVDGPVPSLAIPEVAEVYGRAAAAGVRTLLTGELAEYAYGTRKHLNGQLLLTGRFGALTRNVRELRRRNRRWLRLGRDIAATVTPSPIALRYVRPRRGQIMQLPPWLDVEATGEHGYRGDLAVPPRHRWAELQEAPLRSTSVSIEADAICAAAAGIRIRRPLVDVDVWEFLLSLPAEIKFPDPYGKTLIKQAVRGIVPDAILDRPTKTLFNDFYLDRADYPAMRRLILRGRHRLPYVDYEMLRPRLEAEDLEIFDLRWATDLATIHAFLENW